MVLSNLQSIAAHNRKLPEILSKDSTFLSNGINFRRHNSTFLFLKLFICFLLFFWHNYCSSHVIETYFRL